METKCERNAAQNIARNNSKADARQYNAVQTMAKQTNVDQGTVKHKAVHMQMRRRATPCNVIQYNAVQTLQGTEPEEPGNSENQGRGAQAKIPGKPGWGSQVPSVLFANKLREERGTPRDEG